MDFTAAKWHAVTVIAEAPRGVVTGPSIAPCWASFMPKVPECSMCRHGVDVFTDPSVALAIAVQRLADGNVRVEGIEALHMIAPGPSRN